MEYSSAERRSWMKYYEENGGNVSATCRHFGITRATFYKWANRYDSTRPSRPLRSKSKRPLNVPKPKWGEFELKALAKLDMETGAILGAGRLSERAKANGINMSRSTVGRVLRKIRTKCPVCRKKVGHDPWLHLFESDLEKLRWRIP